LDLNITQIDDQRGWAILALAGEIDIATAPVLDRAFEEVLSSGRTRLAVDLQPVSFMDSTGLRSLISADRRLEQSGGSLAIITSAGPARRLLEVAGVIDALQVVDSVDDLPAR
jgi:anti-anti-sigma factor